MDDGDRTGLGPRLADVAVGAATVAIGFGPALLRRTADQIGFTRALLGAVGCSSAEGDGAATSHDTLAPVVPLRPDVLPEAFEQAAPVASAVPQRRRAPRSPVGSAGDLAIPSYDELAASQVIPLLGGLGSEELEAVRRHEAAGRGRRTVLSRIAQIQAG